MSKSYAKAILIVFFDLQMIIHSEIVPRASTGNAAFYVNVMQRLREKVRRKKPEICQNKSWMVYHDNARSYLSLVIREFSAKHQIYVVPRPTYSPVLTPADFIIFSKLKSSLKDRRHSRTGRNAGSGVCTVEGNTLKETGSGKG